MPFLPGVGTCSVCGLPSWSPKSNKCLEHKPVTSHKKVKSTNKRVGPTNADGTRKPVAAQVVEAAGEITAKTFSAKAPTAGEWEEKLTALVVLLTMTYVEYVVVRPFQLEEPMATNAVASLGMTDDEARTIVEPCSYLLARTEINKKHGREAIEVLAFAPAILAVVAWADRVSSFRREMAQLGAGPERGRHVRTESHETTPGPGRDGGPPVVNFTGVTDPSQAPTSRVNGDRPYVDQPDTAVPA